MNVIGPGEDDAYQLINRMSVTTGSTLHVESGAAWELIWIDLESRTLAEAGETETHSYGMVREQAEWLIAELTRTVGELGSEGATE